MEAVRQIAAALVFVQASVQFIVVTQTVRLIMTVLADALKEN